MRQHFLFLALEQPTDELSLFVEGRDTPIATGLDLAIDSASRRKGLLGRDSYPENRAMIIAPCSGVHTFGMQFPIDVVFTRRDGRILKIRPAMPRARMSIAIRAFAAIEFAAGTAERVRLRVGDRFAIKRL